MTPKGVYNMGIQRYVIKCKAGTEWKRRDLSKHHTDPCPHHPLILLFVFSWLLNIH